MDPGLTVGVAILDLSGEILSVKSFKEVARADITRHIINHGNAVLVATDVHNPPRMVRKMATTLNSKVFYPYKDLAVRYKNELVDEYIYSKDQKPLNKHSPEKKGSIPQNAHERDALAAAIQCYNKYQKKLHQIERRTNDLDFSQDIVDEIKIQVINEVPITKAIDAVTTAIFFSDTVPKEKLSDVTSSDLNLEKTPENVLKLQNKLKSQEKQIKNLQKRNSILENELEIYQNEINQLENKIQKLQQLYSKKILHQREIATKNSIIKGVQEKYYHENQLRKSLEEELKSIKSMRAMELSHEATPVKIIEYFSKDSIREAANKRNIKSGDVILLRSSEGGGSQTASLIVKLGVRAVITVDKMSHQAKEEFEKNMVPLLEETTVNLKKADDFAVIITCDLEREIEKWSKNQAEKMKKEEKNKLLKIMDDYKAQRRRSTNNY